jgi:hypothetical protein
MAPPILHAERLMENDQMYARLVAGFVVGISILVTIVVIAALL